VKEIHLDYSLSELITFAKNLKLLYVEDDQVSRDQTYDILSIFFSDILIAVDGAQACELFDTHDIDFVITDINMPKKNGIEFIQHIRQNNKQIPVFIFSAHSDTSFFLDSISLGVDGYLIKPIESTQFVDQISKTVYKLYMQQQLLDYQHTLEDKVQAQVEEIRAKDNILIQQAKLATMGEMMDIIAHQWKQPINVIAMHASFVKEMHEMDDINTADMISECHSKVDYQIKHLTRTLDDFRAFFRPSENIEIESFKNIINSVLLLVNDELIKNNIIMQTDINEDIKLKVNVNELKHIFINLINNSSDAYKINQIKPRPITITASLMKEKVDIKFCDKAGGIKEEVLPHIFDANYTSKKDMGGTGMGLYMSKFITKKNHGTIDVKTDNNGTCFLLEFDQA
jgi:signal transduction histidine kinase